MTPETHEALRRELEKLLSEFLLWKVREVTGDFASRARFNFFFPAEGELAGHVFEAEFHFSPEMRAEAEQLFLKWEKADLIAAASKALREGDE
jgi:hypothetical protein